MMKKESSFLHFCIIITILSGIFLASCTPPKNVVYFKNMQRDTILNSLVDNNFELKIHKNDLLNINITATNPADMMLFNAPQGAAASSGTSGNSGSSNGVSGYLVDNKGNIIIYKVGIVHVEGLTRNELENKLRNDVAPYVKDPVVTVRFINNHVTMLGEVAKPQIIAMPTEQLTILEAIGQSGDLTLTGRRDNILVIRETEYGKEFKRLNLTDNSIFASPYFYLKPNDVVYVEPTKSRIQNAGDRSLIIGYVLSGLSIVISLLLNLLR
ncbi:MAG TPA: polysaccharide biosynthesis/export family protein [Chitinophagaceae bacterium]|nr:polysaccharide biosynthesis/export family protein [Chitinophagaceae bacterium]